MDIRYYPEDAWFLGTRVDKDVHRQIENFAKFEYQTDVDTFNGSWQWIHDLAFHQLKRQVDLIKNRTEDTVIGKKQIVLLMKIPILWKDWQKDNRWRQPVTIGPDDCPYDGYGRLIVGDVMSRDVRYDILRYKNDDGGIEEAHRLIDILRERSNPVGVNMIDVYYLEHNGLPFSRQVDFLKSRSDIRDYSGEWFVDIYRRWKDSLWIDMVKLIDNTVLECDEDYRNLVKFFCSLPFEHVVSDHLAY